MKASFIFALCALGILGCQTSKYSMPGPDTPSIVLKEAQTRQNANGGTWTVPAGVYEPDFQANDGIYYRAPTHVIGQLWGITSVSRGGIFIPNPIIKPSKTNSSQVYSSSRGEWVTQVSSDTKDLRQGVWRDQQETAGGLFVLAATSPKMVFRVTQPFIYEIHKKEPGD